MKLSYTRLFKRNLEHYPDTTRRLWYLTLTVVATIVLPYDVYVPTSVLPLVLHTFHLSLAGYNLYLVAYLLLSALAALAASVADRLGRANLTVFGLLVCSLIMLGIALSTTLVAFLALGVLLGCAEGIIFVATTALVRDFSPRLGRASAMSFWLLGSTGGTLLAASVASLTLPHLGTWQSQYLLAGIVGLLAFLLCGLGLRELPASLRNQVISIILLKAVWASEVISSASSKITSLKGILVSKPENLANFFTLSLTMLIPRSSDAFNSRVYSRQESPKISLVRHRAVVVLPTPADPENNRCGISDVFLRSDLRLPTISF